MLRVRCDGRRPAIIARMVGDGIDEPRNGLVVDRELPSPRATPFRLADVSDQEMCQSSDSRNPTRREFVGESLAASAIAVGLTPALGAVRSDPVKPPARSNLEVARAAASWIDTARITTDRGVTWPADPTDPSSVGATLYHGSPGVVLFLLDLFNETGDAEVLDRACRGADHLVTTLESSPAMEPGLYSGTAGIAYCLVETFKASKRTEYSAAARRALRTLVENVTAAGSGVEWNSSTDIISGTAGIGLTLLYGEREIGEPKSSDVVVAAGRRLLELGQNDAGGTKWPMSPEYPRLMPNFSHGTAGVCYFLAAVHDTTGDREFLSAAEAGGRYLRSVADTDGDGCQIFHHEPGGENLFYLSWCHGPVGTAQLFYKLASSTGDDEWMDWVNKCARSVMNSGIPERRTPGFWENVSRCCGDVGVGEFFLALHRLTGDPACLDLVQRLRDDLLLRATEDSSGMRWVQAEHRVRPELRLAQTGYMQGAAGIGSFFVHLDAFERGNGPAIVLPDCPFS